MPFITARVVSVIRADSISALAFAGVDQSVLCASLVTLEGEIQGDAVENHTFEWEQTFGTPVTLLNPNTLTPSFVNPQTSDLEFTLYVDRNTPFEDSDAVFISRSPQDSLRNIPGGTNIKLTGDSAPTSSRAMLPQFANIDARMVADAYSFPPPTYTPIYTADGLDKVRNILDGKYWLMNDIDLSTYSNWNSIGTLEQPFRGELQGNGYTIENLTITEAPSIRLRDLYSSDSGIAVDFKQPSGVGLMSTFNEVVDKTSPSNSITYGSLAYVDDGTLNAGSDTGNLFGNFSYHDGNASRYIEFGDSSDFDFGTGDFTIEWYDRIGAWNVVSGVVGASSSPGANGWAITRRRSTESYALWFHNGGATPYTPTGLNGVVTLGEFSHMALVRFSGNLQLYVDGTALGAPVAYASAVDSNSTGLRFGGTSTAAGNSSSYDDLGEFRITKAARYTSNFTPPGEGFTETILRPAGLFTAIGTGTLIEKVGITGANISGVGDSLYKGILAGTALGAVTIRDSYVEGTVDSGGDLAGGLIGDTGTDAGSTFDNTYADVTVTGGGTDTGGWTGTFSGTPTYVENYGNTDKTASVVGTGSPGATEVSGLTTAQLNAEANFTGWDFVDAWEIDEGVSPPTIQEQNLDSDKIISGDTRAEHMISWDRPVVVGPTPLFPKWEYTGAYVERFNSGNWIDKTFYPPETNHASVTGPNSYRLTTIWENVTRGVISRPLEIVHAEGLTTPIGKPFVTEVFNNAPVSVINASNLVITIQNPRKIAKNESESITNLPGDTRADSLALSRYIGLQKDLGIENHTNVPGIGTDGVTLVITRNNGASIG